MHLELCQASIMEIFLQKFSISHRYLWHQYLSNSSNTIEKVDVPHYKEVWLSLTMIFKCCKCFRTFLAKLTFFEEGERRQSTITCPTSYMLVIRWLRLLKSKMLWMAEAVALMSSIITVLLKICNIHRTIPVLESLLNKVTHLQLAMLSKKRPLCRCFPVSFAKEFWIHFFKYTSRQLLLKEHWISLKMVIIAIVINVSNNSYQKEFITFSFLGSAYSKFVEISIEILIKVFLVLEFSPPSKL